MLIIVAVLLALITVLLWRLESAARGIVDRLDALIRASREPTQPAEAAERTGPANSATADEVLRGMGTDLRIIKRRMTYLPMMSQSLRVVEAYVEKRWKMNSSDLDPDVRLLAVHRLQSLRETERQMPLSEKWQREKELLEKFVREWRRDADEDEFDKALGDARRGT